MSKFRSAEAWMLLTLMPSAQQQVNISRDIITHFNLQVWKANEETGELKQRTADVCMEQ